MTADFFKGYLIGVTVMWIIAVTIVLFSGCASGPLCAGTEKEVESCQENMARSRENRRERTGFGRHL